MPRRLKYLVAPLVAIAVLLASALLILQTNHASVMAHNLSQLQARLAIVERMIQRWQRNQLHNAERLAALPPVRAWAARQLQLGPQQAERSADFQLLQQLYSDLGYKGHVLFNEHLQVVNDNYPVPHKHPYQAAAVRQTLLTAQREGAAVSQAFTAPQALLHGYSTPDSTIQIVCAQLSADPSTGTLCLHAELRNGLPELLNSLSSPRNSEIFVVERSGQQLGTSSLWPNPITLKTGDSSQYLEGYLNAHGEHVAGLLKWSNELQLGLVLEQPIDKLYEANAHSRNLVIGLTAFAILLIAWLSLLAQRHRKRLAQREAFYRQVLDHLPLLVRVRNPDGKCLLENQLARDSHLLTHQDLSLQQDQADTHLPPFSREVWLTLRATLLEGRVCERRLTQGDFRSPDFEAKRLIGFPIWDTRGELVALGSIALYESEQVRSRLALQALTDSLEQQVQQRTTELAQAKEVAEAATQAKANFLANMSHEIRSPLNAVIGLAYLAERCNQDPRVAVYQQRILKSAQHLQEVVNGILDFSKLDAGKLQLEQVMFSPERLMENVTDILWEKAQSKQLEMVCDLDPRLPDVLYGDSLRIAQMLINLAENAIKFTAQGMVAVRIRLEEQRGEYWQLCFEVQDSGSGIPAERLLEIFQPFEQLDNSTSRHFGGTGLGLAICAQLAELMGTRIEARSELGVGSLFSFSLSLKGGASHQAPLPGARSARRVLLVDSNAHSRSNLSEMLAALGLQADMASSGQLACTLLSQAQVRDQPYALVLVDWNLPDLPPSELLAWAKPRQLLNHSRVILLSAHGSEQPLADLPLEEYDAVLDKPVSPQRLRETVLRLERSEAHPALEGRHVLLVENETINQDVARELLESLGVRVSLTNNGLAALACLARDASIELVLMDIQMPLMDGLEATRHIRPLYPALPVIAMTASNLAGDRERCLAAGMNDYLAKPIDPQRLADKLRRWLCVQAPVTAALLEQNEALPQKTKDRINRQAALERLLGNERLYHSLLQRFVSEYGQTAEQLEQALAAGEHNRAMEIAHRFKSVAATIGAEHLCELTQHFEEQLREQRPYATCLTSLTLELNALLLQLDDESAGES
ncbi:response regulator [Pseudomonas aeruginosa]|uniref:response regulator n=1 Tax=Pseudomonas aeruginosa TaxID=287 RepID=UPI00141B087E|nr:response regulator [Pseudomonas aeruginosa]